MRNDRYLLQFYATAEERALIKQKAREEGTSLSNFLRRAVNNLLLDSSDDTLLLEEQHPGRKPGTSFHAGGYQRAVEGLKKSISLD